MADHADLRTIAGHVAGFVDIPASVVTVGHAGERAAHQAQRIADPLGDRPHVDADPRTRDEFAAFAVD